MGNKQTIKCRTPDWQTIGRVPKVVQLGNFVLLIVKYNGAEYIVNRGDEYLRGYPDMFQIEENNRVGKRG